MTKKRKKNVKLTNHKEDSELFKLTNQMREPNTFTQIVTINIGNIKMIHKVQLLKLIYLTWLISEYN